MHIYLTFADTLFGPLFIAASDTGVTHLAFLSDRQEARKCIARDFPQAVIFERKTELHDRVLAFLQSNEFEHTIPLQLTGTPFQRTVWQALQSIRHGQCATYTDIARLIGRPQAQRAVGTAIGQNRIAILIPCHRVVPASGGVGNYRWGNDVKKKILKHEG